MGVILRTKEKFEPPTEWLKKRGVIKQGGWEEVLIHRTAEEELEICSGSVRKDYYKDKKSFEIDASHPFIQEQRKNREELSILAPLTLFCAKIPRELEADFLEKIMEVE